jgi:hypothetical protein
LPGVQVHRARNLAREDMTRKDGIPVTTVERTLIDLTDMLTVETNVTGEDRAPHGHRRLPLASRMRRRRA